MYRFGGGLVCSMVCYQICQRFFFSLSLRADETRAPEEKTLPLLLSSRSENVLFCVRCCSCRVSPITELFLSSCLLYFLPALVHHPERLPPCARSASRSHYFFQFAPCVQAPFLLAALFEFKIEALDQVGSLPRPLLITSSQIHFLSDCNP